MITGHNNAAHTHPFTHYTVLIEALMEMPLLCFNELYCFVLIAVSAAVSLTFVGTGICM